MQRQKLTSSGILVFRQKKDLEIFLCHPGGPWYQNRDEGSWTIPKGRVEENEDAFLAALREFEEETGFSLSPDLFYLSLGVSSQKAKDIYAWAIEKDLDLSNGINSNLFEMEYPPNSGQIQEFPEIDKGEYFTIKDALKKIHWSQKIFIINLLKILDKGL